MISPCVYMNSRESSKASIGQNLICGIAGGVAGGFVAVPSDVAMTRMAIDGRQPPHLRRNYTFVTNALWRIYKEEGFLALFTGTLPTVTRAVVVNVSQFVTYFKTKQLLIAHGLFVHSWLRIHVTMAFLADITGNTTPCHLISSILAAFVSTLCVLPTDIAKTR